MSSIPTLIKRKPLHHVDGWSLERAAAVGGKESRKVELSFASDKPITHFSWQHGYIDVILSMSRKHVRTDRLKAAAPLLMDHNTRDQVGVIETFSIGDNGKAKATVRFSQSARGEEIYQDVLDGIRQNISVGAAIHNLTLEKTKTRNTLDVYRADDWEPLEVSIVSVPADISVGIGRNHNTQKRFKMEEKDEVFAGIVPDVRREITEIGAALWVTPLAQRYLREAFDANREPSEEGFRQFIKANRQPTVVPPAMDPRQHAASYGGGIELARSVPRHGKLQAFSGEGAEERAFRFGQFILAGPLGNHAARSWCQQNGLMVTRAQVEGSNEKGGYLVPEEFGEDIVQLMEKYGIIRQHARVIPMSSDRRTDPVLNGELESEFVGEFDEGSEQDLDFGQIGLGARKHMILVPMSTEVTEDSAINIGDQLADAAGRAFAKKEDRCSFIGDASLPFGGIVGMTTALKELDANPANVKGLIVGSGNAYSELTLEDFMKVVGILPDYADIGNAKWFVSRRFYFNVMVKLLLSGEPTATEIEDARNRKFLGYPVVFTPVMPSTEANSQVCVLFGDLNQGARLGDRRRFTTAIDDSIYFKKDALLFRATARFDFNCAFGVGDTTAAGPIVGLITANA